MSQGCALAVMDVPPQLSYAHGFSGRHYHFLKAMAAQWPLRVLALHNGAVDWAPESFLPADIVASQYGCEMLAPNPLNSPGVRGWGRRARHYLIDTLPYMSYPRHLPGLEKGWMEHPPGLVVFFSRASAHLSLQLPARVPTVLILDERWERSWPSSGGVWYQLKKEWITRTERAQTQRLYRNLGDHGDWVVAISEIERKWFSRFFPDEHICVLPHGIDCEFFSPAESEEDIDVAVVGDLSQGRNYEPAIELFEWMESGGLQAFAGLKWAFVGRAPNEAVLALRSSRVMVTGVVPDVRPYYARSKVVVVPSRIGAGAKTTVLQSWAMGRPLVATPFSLLGLPARPTENVLVGESCKELAGHIRSLLQSPGLRCSLGLAGLATARKESDVRHVASRFAELCITALSHARGAVPN